MAECTAPRRKTQENHPSSEPFSIDNRINEASTAPERRDQEDPGRV